MRSRLATWTRLRGRLPAPVAEALAIACVELGAPGVVVGERDLRRTGTPAPRSAPFEAAFPPEIPRRRLRTRLGRTLAALEREFPGRWPASVAIEPYRPPEASESWKRHFRPLRVGRRLLVAPSWEPVEPRGRLLLRVDPGQAFGTGHHPTTRGCLLAIERLCRERTPTRGLDVGSGSGILSLAMRALGVVEVAAVDIDAAARAATADAARRNGVPGIRVLSRLPPARRPFDLVVANLYAGLLVRLAGRLARHLSGHGTLVVSGLLADQEAAVRSALGEAGLGVAGRRCLSRWVTLTAEPLGRRRPSPAQASEPRPRLATKG